MKPLTHLCAVLWITSLLCGCETTQKFFATIKNFAAGDYKATPEQTRLAHQRASTAYKHFSPQEKKTLADSGTRYLAVRTADPTPAQRAEIRADMEKPDSLYSVGAKAPSTIYCVMIWDTQSQQIVGSDCYAVLKLPQPGEVARFDTYTAQYVGNF
ncbi:MAG TPA: hypothetical protein VIS99_09275 [Terrimicrobiaceae bacterium]